MFGIVHNTNRGLVRICESCEEKDPTLKGAGVVHYYGVDRGYDALSGCDHPITQSRSSASRGRGSFLHFLRVVSHTPDLESKSPAICRAF